MTKILIFTGAGVSQESGIETFRGSGGLWNNYNVEEVADIKGWKKDPKKLLDFYNDRRKEMKSVYPNNAHKVIADLEKYFNITLVTQNIDSLHEQAGSTKVIHLHGEMNKARGENSDVIFDAPEKINIGDKAPDGSQMRPHVILFGEDPDPKIIENVKIAASEVEVCIIVGTSMEVYPAAGIPLLTPDTCYIYYVDPSDVNFSLPKIKKFFFTHIKEKATIGMEKISKELIRIFV